METDGAIHQVHARLVGAYWLDSPYLKHPGCCCCAPARPARPWGVTAVGLACLALALAVAVTLT